MASRQDNRPGNVSEVGGILFLACGILLSLSLFSYDWRDISRLHTPPQIPPANFVGPAGAWSGFTLFNVLGLGAYLLPLWCFGLGIYWLFFAQSKRRLRSKALWSMLAIWLIAGWLGLSASWFNGLNRHLNIGNASGGILMGALVNSLVSVVGSWGTRILMATALAATLTAFCGLRPLFAGFRSAGAWLSRSAVRIGHASLLGIQRLRQRQATATATDLPRMQPRFAKPRPATATATPTPTVTPPTPPPADAPQETIKPKQKPVVRKTPDRGKTADRRDQRAALQASETTLGSSTPGYRLPDIGLLDPLPANNQRGLASDTETTARVIKQTLAEFNIACEVTNVEQGPVVTRYELLPAAGVRVERIGGLSNNLALSLKATSVRVQAPIPGKGVVGIEVPNQSASKVFLRQMIESDVWEKRQVQLPIVLGQDVGGNDLLADLATMPHLLIAGATGSGKTVCMNTILAGLLMAKRPDELRLILVDPKIVEFSIYNKLPHLVIPVITDPKKVSIALRWAINEMERRYKLFAKANVRNIAGYNSRPIEQQPELFDDIPPAETKNDAPPERLPYIVVIVDELADLILTSQAEIENSIARLAQLSRAVGIHMIIATQRPSVNVITGTIKANFPGRIAFQVAQKVDSRTILDANGADKLLGRGDMLFLPPGSSKLVRAQGAMTSDDEIHRIVEWAKNQAEPRYEKDIHEKIQNARTDSSAGNGNNGSNSDGEDEELIEASIQIIRETHRASTSSLQRRLRIGYTRAARIMDVLEERGLIGPPRGSDPREILIDLDGEIPENSSDITQTESGEAET